MRRHCPIASSLRFFASDSRAWTNMSHGGSDVDVDDSLGYASNGMSPNSVSRMVRAAGLRRNDPNISSSILHQVLAITRLHERTESIPHVAGNLLGNLKTLRRIKPDALQIADHDADDVIQLQRAV